MTVQTILFHTKICILYISTSVQIISFYQYRCYNLKLTSQCKYVVPSLGTTHDFLYAMTRIQYASVIVNIHGKRRNIYSQQSNTSMPRNTCSHISIPNKINVFMFYVFMWLARARVFLIILIGYAKST